MIIILNGIDSKQIKSILNAYYEATGIAPMYVDQFAEEKKLILLKLDSEYKTNYSENVDDMKFIGDSIIHFEGKYKDEANKLIKEKVDRFNDHVFSKFLTGNKLVEISLAKYNQEGSSFTTFININENDKLDPYGIADHVIHTGEKKGDNSSIVIKNDDTYQSILITMESRFSSVKVSKDDVIDIVTSSLPEKKLEKVYIHGKFIDPKEVASVEANDDSSIQQDSVAEEDQNTENREEINEEPVEDTPIGLINSMPDDVIRHRSITMERVYEYLRDIQRPSSAA